MVESSKFAVAHPVAVADPPSFEWKRYERDGVGLFYGVRPRDPEAHWREISKLVSHAAEIEVTVLVLPELCLTDELLVRLRSHPQLDALPLLIAGSRHVDGSTPGDNEAVIFAHGIEVGRHQKFHPYEFDDEIGPDGRRLSPGVRRREDIRPRTPFIRVYGSGGWSVVVLICKDAIDRDVGELLRALQVQLVIVPSWSSTTEDFYSLAHALAGDPQAVTLVANLPGATGAAAAIFGRPVRDVHVRVREAILGAPNLLWFDLTGKFGSLRQEHRNG